MSAPLPPTTGPGRLALFMFLNSAGSSEGLFRQPHRIELIVEEMARGDGPAAHPGVVGHDAVPLEGIEVVRLLVEQALLELSKEPLPLLCALRAALFLVEGVEGAIDVAAIVDGAPVRRLELVESEIGLRDVAAVEVGGDLEVAARDVAVEDAQLQRLDPGMEADLSPLVDQPHPEGVVRIGDPAILESEGEALGHARLAQEAPRLRA